MSCKPSLKVLSPLKSTLIERALPINRGLNYIQREYWIAREIIDFQPMDSNLDNILDDDDDGNDFSIEGQVMVGGKLYNFL